MTKQFMVFLAIGLAVVAAVVGLTWVGTKGAHLTLDGKVLKVRSVATDEKNSIVVIDFRVSNPTKTPFMVRDGILKVTTADGKEVEGDTIARSDMNRVFDYYKILGPKYNEILIARDRINGGQSIDRTLAASFQLPASDIEQRKNLTLTLNDVDGPQFKFSEH
jgi:hypothetical protein